MSYIIIIIIIIIITIIIIIIIITIINTITITALLKFSSENRFEKSCPNVGLD